MVKNTTTRRALRGSRRHQAGMHEAMDGHRATGSAAGCGSGDFGTVGGASPRSKPRSREGHSRRSTAPWSTPPPVASRGPSSLTLGT
uniref:Uncharacterized protein n=1 Tax=Setaria italica TaxID=4555 RepID=K3YX70_SETIT